MDHQQYQSNDVKLNRQPSDDDTGIRSFWIPCLFLFVVFAAVTPFDFRRTVSEKGQAGLYDVLSVETKIEDAKSGRMGRRLGLFALGIVGALSLRKSDRHGIGLSNINGWLIVGFLAWAAISVVWSENQSVTLKRVVAFLLLCTGALAVADRFSIRDIVRIGIVVSALSLLSAIGAELAMGTFQPLRDGYRFSGIMHPNLLATHCALLIISCVVAASGGDRRFYLGIALGIGCLLLTRSRTATASVFVTILVFYVMTLPLRRTVVYAWSAAAVVFVLLFAAPETVERFSDSAVRLGRAEAGIQSLEGRVPVWELVIRDVGQRPLTGYGFNSAFTPTRLSDFHAELGWAVASTHSNYLAVALELGVLAAIAFVVIHLLATWRSLELLRSSQDITCAFIPLLLLWLGMECVLESVACQAHIPGFIAMVVLAKVAFYESPTINERSTL